jgi:hypothetical protein
MDLDNMRSLGVTAVDVYCKWALALITVVVILAFDIGSAISREISVQSPELPRWAPAATYEVLSQASGDGAALSDPLFAGSRPALAWVQDEGGGH